VRQTGPSQWHATLPAPLPYGDRVPPVRWLNDRIAAARLRQWLDGHTGRRTLRVDPRSAHLAAWLGEDLVTVLEPPVLEPPDREPAAPAGLSRG
jgi:hypothetical protein